MRHVDLTPLMRATVGFDRMMNLLDSADRFDSVPSYPPYNIEKLGENEYRISMAVAGFGEKDLDVTVKENSLTVTGKREKSEAEAQESYLHRGIATRAFERRFELADHIEVTGARIENGLLHVDLVREIPEKMKPKTIKIAAGNGAKRRVLEQKAA